MPLPLTVSCFSKIQIGFTFLVPAHPGSPGKRAVKWYVCVCANEEWRACGCDQVRRVRLALLERLVLPETRDQLDRGAGEVSRELPVPQDSAVLDPSSLDSKDHPDLSEQLAVRDLQVQSPRASRLFRFSVPVLKL